ncbi:hypothetical protein [Boseongicola aestuarii]|uniref:Uncharacterized protein n=1 Tax=Boseongicola aestuarii TaxID=1470561 RepID=A0A238J1I0_9RHOB|nr:hypothetical protein [Boseongicola aestuarii]SMX23830.1 hypothetical protein BOA8489_01943 [Boseongicola aestuarii]
MKIGQARELYVEAHNAIAEKGIASFDGDYGELIVQAAIGGKLIPPTFKDYDLEHPEYGRVQVKTRTLLDRTNKRPNTATCAVFGKNRPFDHLAHLAMDRILGVRGCLIVPLMRVHKHLQRTKGKISFKGSQLSEGALDVSKEAVTAQAKIDEM